MFNMGWNRLFYYIWWCIGRTEPGSKYLLWSLNHSGHILGMGWVAHDGIFWMETGIRSSVVFHQFIPPRGPQSRIKPPPRDDSGNDRKEGHHYFTNYFAQFTRRCWPYTVQLVLRLIGRVPPRLLVLLLLSIFFRVIFSSSSTKSIRKNQAGK